jgi:ABC-type transport system involved in cytochrome c biogenesis permease subunit
MPMNAILLILYAVAGAAYAVQFSRRTFGASRAATVLLVLAAFAHTFVIGMETMRVGHVPFASATSATSMFVWLLALSYLYVELTTSERAMGVFILPLLIALQAIPAASPTLEPRSAVLESPWFSIHVSSLLFAYASFALAAVLGITYVLQFNEIKAKQLGFFYARLPSLNVLDDMNLRAVKIGWLFLTTGLITGGIWASQLQPSGAMPFGDPKVFVAVLCWAVYSFELYAQRAIGWRGRRAAWLSAVGFGIVLLNFVPVSYFFTTSHQF